MAEYDDELSGYLWHENDATVERKGSFTIDGVKYYGAIIKSYNNKGDSKYEFVMSTGLLHLNESGNPQLGGKVTINGKVWKLGCWATESKSGVPYTSLGFEDPEERNRNKTEGDKPAF